MEGRGALDSGEGATRAEASDYLGAVQSPPPSNSAPRWAFLHSQPQQGTGTGLKTRHGAALGHLSQTDQGPKTGRAACLALSQPGSPTLPLSCPYPSLSRMGRCTLLGSLLPEDEIKSRN